MRKNNKTKEQLLKELEKSNFKIAELEKSEIDRMKAEEALLFNQFTIDHYSDAAFWMEHNARFIYVNETACNTLGYSREELLTMTVHDIDPDFSEEVWADHWADLKNRGSFLLESHHRTKDGKVFPIELKVNYMKFGSNEYNCAFARNISERKQAEKEIQKLAAVVKHSSELVNLSTLDGRMTFLNESGGKMLGIEPHEIENVNIMDVIPDHLIGLVEKELLPTLMKGRTWKGDLQYRNLKTGELTDVHAMTFTVMDTDTGEPQFLVNVSLDITEQKKAEKSLRESEEKYRTIFESSPEAIALFDTKGNIIDINGRIGDWLGYKPKDIIGKNLAEFPFLSKKSKELALKRFSLRMTSKEIPPFELEFNDKKGEKHIGLTAATSIKDEKGEITQNLVMISNITEQKQAQKALWESEDRLSKVMLAANDGMWDWNLRTNEVYFDPRYYTMSGYNVGEFPYQLEEFQKRIHPEDTEYVMANAERHLKGEIERFIVEFRFARSDGNWMWILGKGVIVERDDDGSPTRFVGTHTDITKRKQTEAELEKYREHLEELVKERTEEVEKSQKSLVLLLEDVNEINQELRNANTMLNATNKELEAFTYSVSHDLRAPLTRMDGFSKVLIDSYSSNLDDRAVHYLSRIRASNQHMAKLIDDLLSLSRITREKVTRQKADLSLTAGKIANELKASEPGRKVDFEIAKGLSANADRKFVIIILENLLGNAFKFTGKKKNTIIKFGKKIINKKKVFFIKDNGAGFNMKYYDKIFTAFQRLHSNEEYKGSGIGLAIVQRIINKHGGIIWAESEEGKGTTFYFRFE